MNSKCQRPFLKNGIMHPCGSCPSCRLSRSRDWTIRTLHESVSWSGKQVFLTLTYDKEHIPDNYSLNYYHVQIFLKRIRNYLASLGTGRAVKYLVCGEYGPKTGRPHYHMILFGLTTAEVKLMIDTRTPAEKYASPQFRPTEVEFLWNYGFVHVGYNFSPETCAYVAQYSTKKLRNKDYKGGRVPPFIHCSKGFGKEYALEHGCDFFPKGFITYGSHKYSIPRYYFKVFDIDRALYYSDYIARQTEELVSRAHHDGVKIFSPINFLPTTDEPSLQYFMRYKELSYEKGRVLYFGGEWYVVTKQFISWVNAQALARNDKLRAKWRDTREKV